jgi:branched-chain amino acid transport system permease protein
MKSLSASLSGTRARDKALRSLITLAVCIAGGVAVVFALGLAGTEYAFLAAYTVLQFVALASAWNIVGGYAGYVNFGVAGFFAVGVYTSVIVYKTLQWPLIFTIPLAAVIAGLLGLGMGYLTLRLRGVFFSIATLAFSIVLNTLIVNWSFVGGSRGVYVMHPASIDLFGS